MAMDLALRRFRRAYRRRCFNLSGFGSNGKSKREKGKGGKGRFEEAIEEIRKEEFERKKNIRGLADAGAPALDVIKSSFADELDAGYVE